MDTPYFDPEKLKSIRIKNGFTINDIVGRLWLMGMKKASTVLVQKYEAGMCAPGIDYALALAGALGCSIYDFTNGTFEIEDTPDD